MLIAMASADGRSAAGRAVALALLFVAGLATAPLLSNHIHLRGGELSAAPRSVAVGQEALRAVSKEGDASPANGLQVASPAFSALFDYLRQIEFSPLLISISDDKLRSLVRSLGAEDFPRAWALRGQLKSHALEEKLAHILVERWAALNPQAALSAVLRVSGRRARQRLLDSAACSWAREDPAAAAAWVKSFYSEAEQPAKLKLVVGWCDRRHAEASRALWEQMPAGVARDEVAKSLIESLVHEDLNAAIGCLQGIRSTTVRREMQCEILRQWASTDASAALAWAKEQPRVQERDDAIFTIVAALREEHPDQAADLLKSLSASGIGREHGAVGAVLSHWAETDFASAKAWVTQLPEGTLREGALEDLVVSWVRTAPQDAAAFVQKLPEGKGRLNLLNQVAGRWVLNDSKAVQDWMEGMPEGPTRNAVISGFGDGLACKKPEEAAAFVAALPAGDLQAEVALKVVARWTERDPVSAAAWAEAFPAGPTRERAVSALLKEWRNADRYAADDWLKQSGLPAELKERLGRK